MKKSIIIIMALLVMCVSGCATKNKVGNEFNYQSGKVGIGSSKVEVVDVYGKPSSYNAIGELSTYDYSFQWDKALLALDFVEGISVGPTFGLSMLLTDGKLSPNIKNEWRKLSFIFDRKNVVIDFYYHDSDDSGHDESESLFLKSKKAVVKGDYQEAIKLAKQSVAANPNNHRSLNLLAKCLVEKNVDVKAGVDYAKRAVKLWEYNPDYWHNLGMALFKSGDYIGAKINLERAVSLCGVYQALSEDSAVPRYSSEILEQIEQKLATR
jgi:tetratricopeptide (TPR) repeat protein